MALTNVDDQCTGPEHRARGVFLSKHQDVRPALGSRSMLR